MTDKTLTHNNSKADNDVIFIYFMKLKIIIQVLLILYPNLFITIYFCPSIKKFFQKISP